MPVKFIEIAIINATTLDRSKPPKLQCKIEDTACKEGVPVIGLNNTLMKEAIKYMSLNKVIEREKRMINECIGKSVPFCFKLADKHKVHDHDLSSWFASLDFVTGIVTATHSMRPVKVDVKLEPMLYTTTDRCALKKEMEKKLKSRALRWKHQQEHILADTFSKETVAKAYEYVHDASPPHFFKTEPEHDTSQKQYPMRIDVFNTLSFLTATESVCVDGGVLLQCQGKIARAKNLLPASYLSTECEKGVKFCKLSSDTDEEGDTEYDKKDDKTYLDMDKLARMVSTKLQKHFKSCVCPCAKCTAVNSIEKENKKNRDSASKWLSLWKKKTYTVSDGHNFTCNHVSFTHASLTCTCPVAYS
jgi:hypothetical protein